jgi:hypothetical protein
MYDEQLRALLRYVCDGPAAEGVDARAWPGDGSELGEVEVDAREDRSCVCRGRGLRSLGNEVRDRWYIAVDFGLLFWDCAGHSLDLGDVVILVESAWACDSSVALKFNRRSLSRIS